MPVPRLRADGLVKRFGEREVLHGIDLAVDDHEVVALIGASGSGKSTLLRCINLLEPIQGGIIELSGQPISREVSKVDAVRRRIGIVFQQYNLFPHLTVRRNITLAPRRALKLSAEEADERAMGLLARVGLADRADDYPDQLSGGQQQRVAILRALAMEPELLLLDEITSALDPVLVAEVLDLIRELAQGGTTMVIATHEMGFARDVAHRVAFLEGGRILECRPAAELFADPREQATRAFLARVSEAGRL